jgi:hypothetical protein
MELEIVNPQPKYPPVTLIDPAPYGYVQMSAAVDPPRGRVPFPGRSSQKTALLTHLARLSRQLEGIEAVEKATVYRAIVTPPPNGYAKEHASRPARYDVVVLVEANSPDAVGEAEHAEPYTLMRQALEAAAEDLHVMTARCVKRIGDVDKTTDGLFLFNYFVAEDTEVALELWDYLAGWYSVETGLDNSTLLEPIDKTDYAFVNHARWDYGVPRFAFRQFSKPSFRSYMCSPTSRPTGPAPCPSFTVLRADAPLRRGHIGETSHPAATAAATRAPARKASSSGCAQIDRILPGGSTRQSWLHVLSGAISEYACVKRCALRGGHTASSTSARGIDRCSRPCRWTGRPRLLAYR